MPVYAKSTVTSRPETALSVASTVEIPPFSEIDAGATAIDTVGAASSSVIVMVCCWTGSS